MPVVTLGSYDPATYAPELTTARGYPLPHPETATAREDVVKIALALLALDVDVAALVADLATKADATTVLSEAAIDGKIAAEISALINAAPGALNTLGELATALGDDPNFAATLAAQIAERPTAAAVTAQIAAATADGSVTLAKIAPAALSGLDDALITGSPGAAGALAAWDAFGDLGAAPVASTAEMEAGTETALRAMSPSLIAAAVAAGATAAAEIEDSAEIALTAFAETVVGHSLSGAPDLFQMRMRCKVASNGYDIGDEIITPLRSISAGYGVALHSVGAASYTLRQALYWPHVIKKSTGAQEYPTAANWRYVIRAIRLGR